MPVKNYSRQKHAMINIGKFMSRNRTFDFTDFPLFLYLLNEEEWMALNSIIRTENVKVTVMHESRLY